MLWIGVSLHWTGCMHAVTCVTGRVFELQKASYTLKAAHGSSMHDKCQATQDSTPQLPLPQQEHTHSFAGVKLQNFHRQFPLRIMLLWLIHPACARGLSSRPQNLQAVCNLTKPNPSPGNPCKHAGHSRGDNGQMLGSDEDVILQPLHCKGCGVYVGMAVWWLQTC